jgi:hypothetical protein
MKTRLEIALFVVTSILCIAGAVSLVRDPPAPPAGTSYLPTRPQVDAITEEPHHLVIGDDNDNGTSPDSRDRLREEDQTFGK